MSQQLNLFAAQPPEQTEEARIARQRELWRACWNWDGPVVGGWCSFGQAIANSVDGRPRYVSCASAKVLEVTDKDCLVEYHGQRYDDTLKILVDDHEMNGTQFRLSLADVWVDIKSMRGQRKEAA